MPIHTLGLKVPGSWYGLTFADLMSCVMAYLFYFMPGVDHRALYQWFLDVPFMGSVACMAIAGTFIFHKIAEWSGLAFWEAVYSVDRSKGSLPGSRAIASMKIDTEQPWAWDHPDKKVGEKYQELKTKSIKYIVTFHSCVAVFQFFLIYAMSNFKWVDGRLTWSWLPDHPDYRRADPTRIPSKGTVAFQCLVSTFIAETGFYWAHRLMHETSLYYWHKRHHEYRDTTAHAAFYVGFFDSFITDIIPAGFGIVFFDMHQWTILMFTLPLIMNSMRVHCGYDGARLIGFNPSVTLPFCTDVERTHDIHHRTNMCNYGGAYFLMDRLFGTYRSPDDEIAEKKAGKIKQMEKQQYDDDGAGAVAPAPAEAESVPAGKQKAQ